VLRFNKIRLSGFKSFVENTELLIELGLTGVVGPNGCGKSNLVEALRWVMGETSAKQMRGSEMDDVIFGGTANRPPRNVAEVVLTLDNNERSAPAQFNEFDDLEVSRRIEREKGSTYRVNGREVRARDVQLLFADSATGARSTALVSQGRIGAVINAKPQQRRSLLEEAAGITGLHSRRHEAELRLRAADNNLERLDDILVTLDTQLQNLKKQSRQATRYRNLSDHIRKAEATLFHLRWVEADAALNESRDTLAETEKKVTELTVASGAAATLQAEKAAALPALREEEAAAAAELHRVTLARENLDREMERLVAQTEAAEHRLAQIDADVERERSLSDDAKAAIERLAEEKTAIENARQGEEASREKAAQALETSRQDVESLDATLTDLTEKVAASDAKRRGLADRLSELENRRQRLIERGQSVAEQLTRLKDETPERHLVEESERRVEAANAALEAAKSEREAAETAVADRHEGTQAAVARLQDANAALSGLRAEESALSKVLAESDDDLWPPLIDAVQVEPGYETALGTALGDELSAPTDEAAPVHWRTLPPLTESYPLPEGIRPLSEVVDAPVALRRRLAQIGIVETEEHARMAAATLRQGQRIVSRSGALWRWDGYTVTAGAATAAAARLEQRNRLKEIRSQIDAAQEQTTVAENERDRARSREEEARGAERASRDVLEAARTLFDQAREEASQVKERIAAFTSRVESLEQAGRDNAQDLDETDGAKTETERELETIPDPADERAEIGRLRAELAEKRTELLSRQSRFDAIEREARERRQRLSDIETESAGWRDRAAGSETQLADLETRRETLGRELEALRSKPAEIESQQTKLLTTLESAEAKRNDAGDRLAQAEATLREADHALRDAEAALARAREGMVRMEGTVEQNKQASLGIAERVRDKLECRPDQLFEISGLKPDAPLPELEAVERKVDRLIRERETMGPVNLRAEQEAKEMVEQIDTLNVEREDLIQAIDKLRRGIAELNREGRARLLESFKEVDTHFQELFVRLFGGGRAHLQLTEADDPLEAGLEIMASPPGKKLQVLSLLSGGEQALTALALLFGVFLTNPAPICVLDEVDAPLDDANVDRFCSMLEEMAHAQKTRFLIITHHRMTMARMDRLFGVTMSERGVSQLVFVDLHRAEELRDIA